eukprot:m.48006 g.48006  ORF g.48006 m.48006 type:complete len:403 (+) comp33851_c0_seq2:45-1253(+)
MQEVIRETMRDWAAIGAPLQAPDRSLRFLKRVSLVLFLIIAIITIILVLPDEQNPRFAHGRVSSRFNRLSQLSLNTTYPHTSPQLTSNGAWVFRIGIVADLDKDSAVRVDEKAPSKWKSFLRRGHLVLDKNRRWANVRWDSGRLTLVSAVSEKGRGMELSDLVFFDGRLLSVDDRTGIVFGIRGFDRPDTNAEISVVPWAILSDGPGWVSKGFKGEWMTRRDRHIYVGGLGKVWTTTTGEVRNTHPQWIKKVGVLGGIRHINWVENYISLHTALGIHHPGYVIHEAVCWSDVHRRWFFLPRRASHESYNDQDDEHRATNLLVTCDDHFKNIRFQRIGVLNPTVGFSSFKFVPGTEDSVIVALKSEEDKGQIASYVTVFTVDGDILLEPTYIESNKYEGIEFL